MSLVDELGTDTVLTLGWTLVHFLWQGALAAGLLVAAETLFRPRSANARYAFAVAAMAVMAALPALTFARLRTGVAAAAVAEARRAPAAHPDTAAGVVDGAPAVSSPPASEAPLSAAMPALVLLWAAGVALLSARSLGGWVLVQRLKRSGSPGVPEPLAHALERLRRRIGLSRTVRLWQSALVEVPTVIGWIRPVILLPASALTGLTTAQLELILAHELAHVRRFDYLVNLLQTIVETLLFYHPAVWWVSNRIRVEREHCCDDAAVAACGDDALSYARALTELEELRGAVPVMAMAATGGSLTERVRRLVGPPTHVHRSSRWVAGLVVAASVAVAAAAPVLRGNARASALEAAPRAVAVTGPWVAAVPTLARAAVEPASRAIRGVWTARRMEWKKGGGSGSAMFVQLHLERRGNGRHWNSSFPIPLSELKGLAPEQLQAPTADARFELARDAGTVALEGRFQDGDGAGHFTFSPRVDYVQAMRRLGYDGLDDERLFSLAVHDVSRDFIRELAELGYARLALEDLVKMRIHGATPGFVRELKALGYDKLDVEDLVKMRIHGATPEFVRELKALGYDGLDVEGLVKMRIHGATPEFVRELKALGYDRLDVEDLVKMRIHGASPEFVRELKALGYDKLDVETLVRMRIHGVSPDFIRRVQGRSDARVSPDRLVEMRIHGREP